MTPAEYAEIRRKLGTQTHVAKMLEIDLRTLQRREAGHTPITFEARFSLTMLLQQLVMFPEQPLE